MGKKITTEEIQKKSLKFYQTYHTFNSHAVKKYEPLLYKHIISQYKVFDAIFEDLKEIKDLGSRIWTHNNICLTYDVVPEEVIKQINISYGGTERLKEVIERTFKSHKDLDSELLNKEEVYEFIQDFLNVNLDVYTDTNDIQYAKEALFGKKFYLLDGKYKHPSDHKSQYAYDKYRKAVNKQISQKDSVVIDLIGVCSVRDILKQISIGGINIHNDFNILSIDPPTSTNMGYCILHYEDGECEIVESGTYSMERCYYRGSSLKLLYSFLDGIVQDYDCKVMISESAFGKGVLKTRTMLNENVGIFQLIGELYNKPVHAISPLHFKSEIIGRSGADKEETIKWALQFSGKSGEMQEHEADAIAIGVCYLVDRELISIPNIGD